LAEGVVDAGPRREVDRHACAASARDLSCARRRDRDRLALERVPGEVEHVAIEPCGLELRGRQLRCRTAVRCHRPLIRRGDRDDDARPLTERPTYLPSSITQLTRDELAR